MYKPVYDRYRKSTDKEKFLRGQESKIILFESAAKALKQMGVQKLPDTVALKQEMAALTEEKKQEYSQYQQIRTQAREMETIKKNVDSLLSAPDKSQRETTHERN